MSPEQKTSPQFLRIKEIAVLAGFDPNPKDLAVAYGRIHALRENDPTIVPDSIDGRQHLYTKEVAEKIVHGITGPIKRTSGTLADGIEVEPPQEHSFTNNLSQDELLKRSMLERKSARSKRQAQEQRKKEAEIIKQQMPIYFTNEVLAHILEGRLDTLNRSVRLALDRALKKINADNNNITVAFIFEGKSEDEIKQFFILNFIYTLEKGFNNTKNPQDLSGQEKQLIDHCSKLKELEKLGWSRSTIIKDVYRHFDIPPTEEFLHPLGRLNSQKI